MSAPKEWPIYKTTLWSYGAEFVYEMATARGALAAIENAQHRHFQAGHSLRDVTAVTVVPQ